jgi:hypothetical protein
MSPAGFEDYFRELAPVLAAAGLGDPRAADIRSRYGLDPDPASAQILAERFGLRLG